MVLVVVVVDEQPHDHGRHEAHGVAQRIDDAHEGAGEVVSDVEHGALLPRVDEPVAAHRAGLGVTGDVSLPIQTVS